MNRQLVSDISTDKNGSNHIAKRQRLSLKKWKRDSAGPATLPALETAKVCVQNDEKREILPVDGQCFDQQTIKLDGNLSRNLCPVSTLNNLGNTCYLNSILYTLRYMKEFRKSLHDLSCRIQELASSTICDYHLDLQHRVILDLHELFQGMHNSELGENCKESQSKATHAPHLCKPLSPSRLMESLRKANDVYEGNRQHDAHEFLGFLLSCLEKTFQTHEHWLLQLQSRTVTRRNRKALTVVQNHISCPIATFEGTCLLKTLCLECETYSEMEDKFRDVAIPCLNHLEIDANENEIDGFVRALQMKETLREDEKFWCNICYHHNEARRSGQFVQLPPIFIIQLKPALMSTTILKGNTCLDEPGALPHVLPCLLESCIKPCSRLGHQFQLSAIVCHIGSSLSSGHYTVYLNGSSLTVDSVPDSNQAGTPPPPPQRQNMQTKTRYNTRKTTSKDDSGEVKDNPTIPQSQCGDCCSPGDLLSPNQWLHFDDEKLVSVQNLPKFHRENSMETPYLLFYQKLAEIDEAS